MPFKPASWTARPDPDMYWGTDAAGVEQWLPSAAGGYLSPSFTSFSIQGQANPLEVGDSIPAGVTFIWSTTNPGNVQPNTVDILDVTLGLTLATGLPNTGSAAVVMPGAITYSAVTGHTFQIRAQNTNLVTFSRTALYGWQWRVFSGTSAATTLNEAGIHGLANQNVTANITGIYVLAAGNYKYLCYSDALGDKISSVKDAMTGFNVPMATVTQDAFYANLDGAGFYYGLVSVTNGFGVTHNYRVYRSFNALGAQVTLWVG